MTIVCAMLLAASSAQANDTELYSVGGELRPKRNTSIRLSYELIDLKINADVAAPFMSEVAAADARR